MKTLCICEICICGRHRCPHQGTSIICGPCKLGLPNTEYTDKYIPHSGYTVPKTLKPEEALKKQGRLDEGSYYSTEFRDSYQKWPVYPRPLPKPSEYTRPTAPMSSKTTTHTDFIRHNVQPFVPAKPLSRPLKSGPFCGSTTMRDDYKAWEPSRVDMIKRSDNIGKTNDKMEDMTTFRAHYTPHELQPRISCRPKNAMPISDIPFDGRTTYHCEYTPKEVTVCPASFSCPPGFVFERSNEQGHRLFRKVAHARA